MRDSFIHITDLHFWEIVLNPFRLLNKRALGNLNVVTKRRHEFIMERAWNYLDYVSGLPQSHVIITGDFSSTSTEWEFREGVKFCEALENAGKTVSVIAGNHDVYTFASERNETFSKHYSRWLPQKLLPTVQSLPGGTPILYLPTVCANAVSSMGRITQGQLDEAAALLQPIESPLVVAGHYPFLNRTETYTIESNRQLRDADRLENMLGESGKYLLYISGHVHRFSDTLHPRYPNLRHLTSGAFFRTAPESNADGDFSVIEISDDGSFAITRHLHQNGSWTANKSAPNPD